MGNKLTYSSPKVTCLIAPMYKLLTVALIKGEKHRYFPIHVQYNNGTTYEAPLHRYKPKLVVH